VFYLTEPVQYYYPLVRWLSSFFQEIIHHWLWTQESLEVPLVNMAKDFFVLFGRRVGNLTNFSEVIALIFGDQDII
jgi:hypothetical protein